MKEITVKQVEAYAVRDQTTNVLSGRYTWEESAIRKAAEINGSRAAYVYVQKETLLTHDSAGYYFAPATVEGPSDLDRSNREKAEKKAVLIAALVDKGFDIDEVKEILS